MRSMDRPPVRKKRTMQDRGEEPEDDVQPRGVVPCDALVGDLRGVGARYQAKAAEDDLDHVPGRHHRRVERAEYERGHPRPVVLAVDVEDRGDDQVGEQERDHPAEADPALPQHDGQRDVADRADERDDRHDGADQRAPDLGGQRVPGEEERLPERVGHPGGDRARDEQPDRQVPDDRRPLHHEHVAHRGETAAGQQPLAERAGAADGHVHRGVPLHRACERPGRPAGAPRAAAFR